VVVKKISVSEAHLLEYHFEVHAEFVNVVILRARSNLLNDYSLFRKACSF